MSQPPDSVAIFGPGLMGGSLLKAFRERHPSVKLAVWARRKEALAGIEASGLADLSSIDPCEVASAARCLVLCLPVDRLAGLGRRIAPSVAPDAVVTDVGSVKSPVVADMEGIFAEHGNFAGSHPMCGSEAAGLEASRADLYEGAVCVVTPTRRTKTGVLGRVEGLWRSVGSRILTMDPESHDRAAALVSHLPHVAAAALVRMVGGGRPDFREMCAGGFRDATRIAAAPADLWTSILASNRHEVAGSIEELCRMLSEVAEAMKRDDFRKVHEFLALAARERAEIVSNS